MVTTAPFVSAKSPTPDRSLTPSIGLVAAVLIGLADSVEHVTNMATLASVRFTVERYAKGLLFAEMLKADSFLTPTLHEAPFD